MSEYERIGDPQTGDYAFDSRTEKHIKLVCKLNTIDSYDTYWVAEDFGDKPYFIVSQSELTNIMYFGD